ncbi:hypothetical protein LTR84_003788 [Exophiala bonariae]|uniref:Glutamine amidotransferase domain-containing protein n=1 Tax=Exophiala bonariae TaxID=1690606 RepID=A0AAV9N7A5_9EURO|nr:hypothetical protein LTR84_003788 [Exophiala bonariae]
MGSTSELRLAILVNHPPHTTFWPEVKQAFVDAFAIVAPHARIDFYDPIIKREYPDPLKYDLIILSGGKGNSLSAEPWILRQINFVKDMVERYPRKKILGICFGHQVIAQALGGKARDIPSGPIAGLVKINLTEAGLKFFPGCATKGHYAASQFHVREVNEAPPGFTPLAENNEALLSHSNTVISFQAHPEIDGIFSRKILDDDDPTYIEHLTSAEVDDLKNHCADAQDGTDMLARVIAWVEEGPEL